MTKFALLVGINYTGNIALKGCINDVVAMKHYLEIKRGYKPENIVLLTDDGKNNGIPTGRNIMHQLALLILKAKTQNAEEIWFHYSGHGDSTVDLDHDEIDGKDETIIPVDIRNNGYITDDQLYDYLCHLPATCKMYCIMDCCHSGTILDLPYRYISGTNVTENTKAKLNGNIIMISGSRDNQTSADAYIEGRWRGALSVGFLKCVEENITCSGLLEKIRGYLIDNNYTQYPQICTSFKIDNNTKFF